jgi:glycosyltransferase involved in cell wall biosynthesis
MQSGLDKRDWFHNKVFKRLDGCITITERGREELTTTTVLAPEKIAVVHYGIDTTRFSPESISREEARRTFGIPEDAFTVGIVGGFNPGKGQKEFIEGLRIAAEMEPGLGDRLHALIVGERPSDPADYVAEIGRLRQSLPFADRVQLLPFTSDPRPVYRALDIFVLASHSETFGMVLQEALAMGVPSVGTNNGGVPEIITDGRTGLLIEPQSPQAIADAVVKLYRDELLRSHIAHTGREFAIRTYDADRQYRRFEEVLGEAVGRRRL